jgi:parvulin-like peptidyl-prolyl isomerase
MRSAALRRFGLSVLVAGLALLTMVPGPARAAEPLFNDPVMARGKDFEIRRSQVDEMFLAFKATRSAMGQKIPEAMRPRIQADILDKLIATQVCLHRATADDRAKAKKISEDFIKEQIKQAPSEEAFDRQLRIAGMSPEQFRNQISEQAIVKAVIDRELKTRKSVSDEEVKKYYDDHPNAFRAPEMVRVSHILISTQDANGRELSNEGLLEKRRLAEQVMERAKSGENFEKLVKEFSEDENSKNKGGEYTFAHAKDTPGRAMVPEFEAAAFSLAPNQISDLVRTRFGYHIIKLLEKIPSKRSDFAEVSEKIKDTLLQDEVQKELPDFIEKLRKESQVEILIDPAGN